jgi:hypothetical protein
MNEPNVIDLTIIRKAFSNQLNESKSDIIAFWIQTLVSSVQGDGKPVKLKGEKEELRTLVRAIGFEKRFIADSLRYGLDHPTTIKTKALLQDAVEEFVSITSIPWPFKD